MRINHLLYATRIGVECKAEKTSPADRTDICVLMNQQVEAIRSGALRKPHREDHFFLKVEEIRWCLVKGE
jgi:hypothetical protein